MLLKGGLLYSLLHLGGFPGDVEHYSRRTAGCASVLELGCGNGRLAEALLGGAGRDSPLERYLGVDHCLEFVEAAGRRLGAASAGTAQFVHADLAAPCSAAAHDAVVLAANTLFCTPRHAEVLRRCADAVPAGGRLELDVYNALPWHDEAAAAADDAAYAAEEDDGLWAAAEPAPEELLVRVDDEQGASWRVYEHEPVVDPPPGRRIRCRYTFVAEGGERHAEELVHHYLLPEELVRLVDAAGFEIESILGDFEGKVFHPDESEHVVLSARKR